MNWIQSFLSEEGSSSSMRLQMMYVVGLVMGAWAYVSIRELELQALPETVVAVLIASIGAKYVQRKYSEDKKCALSEVPETEAPK